MFEAEKSEGEGDERAAHHHYSIGSAMTHMCVMMQHICKKGVELRMRALLF